jgi:trigger factor
MTKVLKNKKKGYTVSLEIEISPETINTALDATFKRLSKSAKVPGFRKGKVPRNIFEKHYGKGVLIQEGLSDAVNMSYGEAIRDLDLQVVDYPKNVEIGEYADNKPVKFTCEVDVKPDVKLGKYKGLKVSKDPSEATEEQINQNIEQLQENFADFKESEEKSETDDMVTLAIKATQDGTEIEQWTKDAMTIKLGLKNFGEDFDNEIEGLKLNDEKSFNITFPEDYAKTEVAGKEVAFEVKVTEVRKKALPELDDAFAEKVSNGQIKTYKELKEDMVKRLNEQAEKNSEEKFRGDLIDLAADDAKVEIPASMVESEIDNDVRQYEQQITRSGGNLEQYLGLIGQSPEQFREQLRENAEKRVRAELVLTAIVEKEKIQVSDDDIKAEIKTLLPSADTDEKVEEEMKKINLEGFRQMLKQRKAVDVLIDNAKIAKK